jgi:hypothetical protein
MSPTTHPCPRCKGTKASPTRIYPDDARYGGPVVVVASCAYCAGSGIDPHARLSHPDDPTPPDDRPERFRDDAHAERWEDFFLC